MPYIIVWPGGLKVPETNRCLSLALEPSQGSGWREFGGIGWIFPESIVGTFEIFTADDQPVTCITDARTGLTYNLATRDGPTGSGIMRRFIDQYNSRYGGIEIPWIVRFKEHTAPEEHELIKHLLSYFNFRPQNDANMDATGYNAGGYRTAQEISLVVYKDGETVRATITRNIPVKGAIPFDQQITANRIQLELQGTASELRITEQRTEYELLDQRVAPINRLMNYHQYQMDLAKPLFRVSRGKNLLLNLADGSTVSGAISSSTTGPDGALNSAMVFSAASQISAPFSGTLAADFTIMAGISTIIGTIEICRIGLLIISIQNIGGTYFLIVNDSGVLYTQGLSWNGTGWVSLKITRSGDHWIIGENGSNIMTFPIVGAINSYSGTFSMIVGNAKRAFDVRLYGSVISAEAYQYYYENVTLENGKAVLPIV